MQSRGYEDSWFPTHSAKDAEWMGHPAPGSANYTRIANSVSTANLLPAYIAHMPNGARAVVGNE
jgi:hypothetical protein